MLNAVKKVLPRGNNDWLQVTSHYNNSIDRRYLSTKDDSQIQSKFNNLPTGNAESDTILVKQLKL